MRTWEDYKRTMPQEPELFALARSGDAESLSQVLMTSAQVNAKDHKGYSPLMLAAYHGHEEAVLLLLAAGADPDASDLGGSTILMGAAFKGHLDIVKHLIQAGARIDAITPKGQTALSFAQMFGRAEVALYLKSLQQQTAVFGWRDIISGWCSFLFNRRGAHENH